MRTMTRGKAPRSSMPTASMPTPVEWRAALSIPAPQVWIRPRLLAGPSTGRLAVTDGGLQPGPLLGVLEAGLQGDLEQPPEGDVLGQLLPVPAVPVLPQVDSRGARRGRQGRSLWAAGHLVEVPAVVAVEIDHQGPAGQAHTDHHLAGGQRPVVALGDRAAGLAAELHGRGSGPCRSVLFGHESAPLLYGQQLPGQRRRLHRL